MKILQTIKEEIVPLSTKQGLALSITIACVFQFVLFYAPTITNEAIKEALAVEKSLTELQQVTESQVQAVKLEKSDETSVVLVENNKTNSSTVNHTSSTVNHTKEITETDKNTDDLVVETDSTSNTEPKIVRISTHVMTAYNSDPRQTDDSPCITANGFNVCEHGVEDTIAANFLKFGTKVMIPELFGDRVFVVRDRMNKRYSDRVDIWMKDYEDAKKFGVKTAKIQVIE